MMHIIRDQLENSLLNFINSGNGIIIGPPGIGKTFLLKKICSEFEKQQIPFFYLPIDKFNIENNQDLESTLRFKGDFIEVLSNQPKTHNNKGFLIIDSFDSAKSEKSIKFFLNIIERAINQLNNNWQIIVSVRIFDAKKSQKLLELFPRSPEEEESEYHSDYIRCRHFLIPKLTDIELESALEEKISQEKISAVSSSDIWDLLKIPFNLWIFEQVLIVENSIIELQKIRSQVGLLDIFWRKRVHDTASWEDKEIILRSATREMVKSKTLFVNYENIYQSDKKSAWRSLLSDQILVETSKTGQNYAFSHNILFDYAVSILLLDESESSFFSFISEDISRQLFLRPSLDFYFTHLWHSNPEQYWKIIWKILLSNEINLNILLRLTSVNVLINEIEYIDELNPIFFNLEKSNPQGIHAVLYILQSLDAQNTEKNKIWLEFLEKISVYLNKGFIWNFAWILSKIIDKAKIENNLENLQYSGKISRVLLSWILSERKKKQTGFIDSVGANWAVPLVAKTFGSDPKKSADLLKDVLTIRQEPGFPIMYIYHLVDELENIWPFDLELTEFIYLTVLSYEETSMEKTPMGTPVLPLSSTRRQDYGICQYLLAKQYPKFLSDNPLFAAKTAVIALNQYIIQNHIIPFINPGYCLEDIKQNYVLNNNESLIYPDGCYIWDTFGHPEEPIKIADELFNYIERKAEQNDSESIDGFINIFLENVNVSFFWRRLLITAVKYPEIFADKLSVLCTVKPILSGAETIKEMADFLQKASSFFSLEQLFQIEKTILEIPKDYEFSSDEYEYFESIRDRLLSRIPKDLLKTDDGIAIRNSMEKRKIILKNEPLVKIEAGIKDISEEEFLSDEGVDFSQKSNKTLFQLLNPLREFSTKWLNEKPDLDSIKKILPKLKDFYLILEREPSADIKVKTSAWTHLTSCISEISNEIDPTDNDSLKFCMEVLLKGACHPEPIFDPKYHSTFDSPAWSPYPRNEAAIGLPKLASIIPEQEILIKIKKLAIEDPVPSVRYLTISHLLYIWETAPDFVWDLLTEVTKKEQVSTILFAACRDIGKIFRSDEKKAELLLELLFKKTITEKNPDRSNPLYSIIVRFSIVHQNEWATASLSKIINNPIIYSKHFGYLVDELSRYIAPRVLDDTQEYDEWSDRTIEMLNKIITATQSRIDKLNSSFKEKKIISSDSEINELYLVIHEVVLRLFFAIGRNKDDINKTQSLIFDKKREQLYLRSKPLIEKIIQFSNKENSLKFNASTLHYLIQIYNKAVDFDPEYVIHTMAGLLKNGDFANYSTDPLAVNEILMFGEKIISDYKDLLQDKIVLNDFIIIIDSFVKTGNKEMMQFVWRLDEIYR